MSPHVSSFVRRYRSALLDYLLGNGETGRMRAYDLGRLAIDNGIGLLQILGAHQKAIHAVLESAQSVEASLARLKASEEFLMDTLSPFEMTYRGVVGSNATTPRTPTGPHPPASHAGRTHRRRPL
jgi:hypothetical protein